MVIAIIGVLVALLLPAVQAARESARLAQCKNHLRQNSLAMLQYELHHQSFPTGGWSSAWVGDPNVGSGGRQPGGWIYQSLPYLEQQTIAQIGLGLSGSDLINALTEQCTATLPTFHCPSRRPAELYPALELRTMNYLPLDFAAKTDYAANGGSELLIFGRSGPARGPDFVQSDCWLGYPDCNWMNQQWWIDQRWNGIVGDHHGAKISQITDGTSKTLLIGEKWVYELYYAVVTIDATNDNSTNQFPADNPGDNGSLFCGFDLDNVRGCSENLPPKRDAEFNAKNQQTDKKGSHYKEQFGSSHPAGLNLARCDASVDTWNFDVDPHVWASLGARNDESL